MSVTNRALNLTNRLIFGPILRFFFIRLALSKKFLFLNTNTSAIGHLCVDVFCFLREKAIHGHPYDGIILASRGRVANITIAEIWGNTPGIIVVKNPLLCFLMDYLRTYEQTSHDCSGYAAVLNRTGEKYLLFNFDKNINPVVSIGSGLLHRGRLLFKQSFPELDVDRTVVLHARDSYFDKKTKNPNLLTQENRNSPIESYISILRYLKSRGYAAIRIGDFYRNPLYDKVFYYSIEGLNKKDKDLLQVYLSNQSPLFLGSSSGAIAMAQIWNRPVFALNVLPYAGWRLLTSNSMSIPKLMFRDGKILTFREIYKYGFHLLEHDKEFLANGIDIIANNPDDCLRDFIDFFDAFIQKNENARLKLVNSVEQSTYINLRPKGCHDYHSKSLVPTHFFQKYKLLH
jgi:putative glycosyltransferase (TIGR04372 family)